MVAPAPGADKERFEIEVPEIIDPETFDRAQELIPATSGAWRKARNIPETGGKPRAAYALSGGRLVHLHASAVEAPLFGFSRNGERFCRCSHSVKKYRVRWEGRPEFDRCDGFGRHPLNGMKRTSISAREVESTLLFRLVRAFEDEDALAKLQRRSFEQGQAAADTADLLSFALDEAADLQRQRERLEANSRRLDEEVFASQMDELEADERANKARIAGLSDRQLRRRPGPHLLFR